jgi:superfamily II DNA or RNA helicase
MIQLRPFQAELKQSIIQQWSSGVRNILAVMPTGAGKTVLFSDIIANTPGACIAIAHRQEIVTQISLALARNEVRHRVIGPKSVSSACSQLHLMELNRNYVDPMNRVIVAGVDTLIRMDFEPWMAAVTLVVQDEAHHLLKKNKWGKAQALFRNAKGLGVTATPCRADGHGLGSHADGVMDTMIVGPSMRTLIDEGWLTEYRIFAPPSDLDLRNVPISASGDFSPPKLSEAVHKSHIVGDVVDHYLRIAKGKLGVTFAVDVEAAGDIATAFKKAGVPAEIVTAKTPDTLRASILRRFRNRELLQLVNVDLFGEGFDLPAIEVVSMARPTQSFSLFAQQFGRALRPMAGKEHAIIIDHVGNVHRHGLPDAPRDWSLDRRERRSSKNVDIVIPTRTCPECAGAYERIRKACPYCGHAPEPSGRSSPQEVDGDLYELTPEALAKLRGEIDPPIKLPFGAKPEVIGAIKKHHRERQSAQADLRLVMSMWGGKWTAYGDSLSEAQRRFYHTFGVDVATAQTLGRKEAEELKKRVETLL